MLRPTGNAVLHLLLLCSLITSGTLRAGELTGSPDDTSFSPYPYVGAKAGWMHYQNACEDWNVGCDGDDNAFGGFAGYQINEFLGFEAAWLDLGNAVGIYPEGGVNQTYTGSMAGWEFSFLGRFGLTENLDAFIKAGAFVWDGENQGPRRTDTDSGTAPMAGVGLEYQFARHWSARLEYQYIDSLGSDKLGGSNGHFTSLGVIYRFGSEPEPVVSTTPEPEPQPVVVMPTTVSQTLEALHLVTLFAFDSSALTDTAALDTALERLQRYPTAKVQLKGYTDAKGSNAYNLKLSERRAQAVADYFMARGISADRIQTQAFGEDFPAAANDSAEHRHLNRRVDVFSPSIVIEVDVTPVSNDANAR